MPESWERDDGHRRGQYVAVSKMLQGQAKGGEHAKTLTEEAQRVELKWNPTPRALPTS